MDNHNDLIQVTRFTGVDGSRLTKAFSLDEAGQICKDNAPQFIDGTARRKQLMQLASVEKLIDTLQPNEAIATGVFDEKKVAIRPAAQITGKLFEAGYRARSLQHMAQPARGLVLLDHDAETYMPQPLRCETPAELVRMLTDAVPEFAELGYSGVQSCSRGVKAIATNEVYAGGGLHVYLEAHDTDLGELRRFLEAKLWLAGLGYIGFARNGAMLPRAIIDLSVLSPERLIFEAAPVLGPGLVQNDRTWQHVEGAPLAGRFELAVKQVAELDRLLANAKADPRVVSTVRELQEAYIGAKAKELADVQGISIDEARGRIAPRIVQAGERQRAVLYADDTVWINGKLLTVAQLLEQGEKLSDTAMPDPVEGPAYGRTTAKFYFNNGDTPIIHSFAHGIPTAYRLLPRPFPITSATGLTKANATVEQGIGASMHRPPSELDPTRFPHTRFVKKDLAVPRATIENVEHLLISYGIEVNYDVISKQLRFVVPGLAGSPDNFENSALTHVVSLCQLNSLPTGHVADYVAAIGDRHQVNPVADYIYSRPWDGIDRLPALYATLETAEDYPEWLKERLIYRWVLSTVAAAVKPSGFHSRGVLVLQGAQGIGKTRWVMALVPDDVLREGVVLTGHHLDASNKDSKLNAVRHWIVELGELDSTFKKDVALLKSFISNDVDKIRKPYGKAESTYARRTVFCATVNDAEFLVDDTGNTRFWTIPVTAVNYRHGIDMQQVYAQLAHSFAVDRDQWWLTTEEETALAERNVRHQAVNAVRDLLEAQLDFDTPDVGRKWSLKTAAQVLQYVGIKEPKNQQMRDCGKFLREKVGDPTRSQGKTRWRVPIRDDDMRFP